MQLLWLVESSQRRYDDYMKNRPTYDPGQNPFMANGGGIQAFADGNKVEPIGQKRLSEMMIMNMKEKPMSFLDEVYGSRICT